MHTILSNGSMYVNVNEHILKLFMFVYVQEAYVFISQ
jgi:hypothetical protein